MINDMASLKKVMEQMDAEDVAVAEAAKDRAAKILSDSGLNFSKLAELIEQRRLLLRPRIVTNIKKMDQPEMLSDAVFRDVSASLRREGQSFRQIAEALELNGGTAPRYEDVTRNSYVPVRLWPRALAFAMRTVGYPLRHPIRFLIVALLALMLLNGLRDFAGLGRRISGYAGGVSAARERWDAVTSSVSSFFEKRTHAAIEGSRGAADLCRSRPASLARQPAAVSNSVDRSRRHAAPSARSWRNDDCPSFDDCTSFKAGSERSSANGATARARGMDASGYPPQLPDGEGGVLAASAVATGAVVSIDRVKDVLKILF